MTLNFSKSFCYISLLVSTIPAVHVAILMGNRAHLFLLTVMIRNRLKEERERGQERKWAKEWEGQRIFCAIVNAIAWLSCQRRIVWFSESTYYYLSYQD